MDILAKCQDTWGDEADESYEGWAQDENGEWYETDAGKYLQASPAETTLPTDDAEVSRSLIEFSFIDDII